jgi:hypothetical protein
MKLVLLQATSTSPSLTSGGPSPSGATTQNNVEAEPTIVGTIETAEAGGASYVVDDDDDDVHAAEAGGTTETMEGLMCMQLDPVLIC